MNFTAARLTRPLRIAAAGTAAAVLLLWLATGAHPGWSRTSLTTMQHDEVTGIDYPVQRPGFIAGVEVLAAGLGAAAALAGLSLVTQRRSAARV